MAGQVQLIPFGGTLLMKQQGAEGHQPFYSVADVALHKYLQLLQNRPVPEAATQGYRNAQQALLDRGIDAYADIGRALTQCPSMNDADAIRTAKAHALEAARAALGIDVNAQKLPFDPIDSINFDLDTHYPALREAVLETIRAGNIPLIAGGTDTLRFYGTLLAEDLKQLHASGQIPHLPPVIIASSMQAFGDTEKGTEQNHVYRILKAARVAADEAVIAGLSGVFALLPHDAEVSAASLLDLQQPCDKISAVMDKAFVGSEVRSIDPDKPVPGDAYPNHDMRRFALGMARDIAPYRHQPVSPPLEASNSPMAVAQVLYTIQRNPLRYPYQSVIIKGDLSHASSAETAMVAGVVARLAAHDVQVFFVNDAVAHPVTGALEFPATKPNPVLQQAGAIFLNDTTSTQAYIRAGMIDVSSGQEQPAHYRLEREDAKARAQAYVQQHPLDSAALERKLYGVGTEQFGAKRAQALAIEYVAVANAYGRMIDLAVHEKIRRVISVNCTDGSMSVHHAPMLSAAQREGTYVTGTFKYAGTMRGHGRETASMKLYAPAVTLANAGLVAPGGDKSPDQLLSKAASRGIL